MLKTIAYFEALLAQNDVRESLTMGPAA